MRMWLELEVVMVSGFSPATTVGEWSFADLERNFHQDRGKWKGSESGQVITKTYHLYLQLRPYILQHNASYKVPRKEKKVR